MPLTGVEADMVRVVVATERERDAVDRDAIELSRVAICLLDLADQGTVHRRIPPSPRWASPRPRPVDAPSDRWSGRLGQPYTGLRPGSPPKRPRQVGRLSRLDDAGLRWPAPLRAHALAGALACGAPGRLASLARARRSQTRSRERVGRGVVDRYGAFVPSRPKSSSRRITSSSSGVETSMSSTRSIAS